MVASRERQHGTRIPRLDRYKTKILPIAAVYGGNASGKTNFFKALRFVQKLVVKGTQPDSLIGIENFQLDANSIQEPSRFDLELLIDDVIYNFSFAATTNVILEEKLVEITSTSEKVLYDRHDGKPNFGKSLTDTQFLDFAFKGTRDNQLFLTNSVSQKVDNFKPVYDWFQNSLELIAPDTRFGPFDQFLDEKQPLYSIMNELLPQLDTGIDHLGGEEIPWENLPLPDIIKAKIQEDAKEKATFLINYSNKRYVINRKDGKLIGKNLITYHPKSDGSMVKFEISQESDGSQRVIDLLPAFLDLSEQKSKKVYVIDEIDRSLHTLLIRKLLEAYLDSCSTKTRSQLLFTTHNVLLMDQTLLRRDEMWVTERDFHGISDLFSFSDYKDIRYDKDVQKSYLQGRLGGIPRILLSGSLTNSCFIENNEEV